MGGILSKPKTPAAPDPAATARAQAEANRIAQFTPSGNLQFGTVGSGGQFVEDTGGTQKALNVVETPFQESLRTSAETGILDLASQLEGTELNPVRTAAQIEGGNFPDLQTDFSTEAQRSEDATFGAASQRLQPQFDRQREQIEQRLADQGLPIGSEAYEGELNRLEESQNEQLSRLALDSVAQGRSEQDRLARLSAALRGQGINEQLSLAGVEQNARQQSFGELGSLLGFNTPFTQQAFNQVDVAGITNQGYQNQRQAAGDRQAAAQQQSSNMGGIAKLGAFVFSDSRMKENIEYVGMGNTYKTYEFNYIGDSQRYRGVMAQDVIKTQPDAVAIMDNGYMAVNYGAIGETMEAV